MLLLVLLAGCGLSQSETLREVSLVTFVGVRNSRLQFVGCLDGGKGNLPTLVEKGHNIQTSPSLSLTGVKAYG